MNVVLMLSYFFPPISGGGVQRSIKFAKYLPLYGWQPIVIGAQPNRRSMIEQGSDASLVKDIGPETRVIRTRSIEFSMLYGALHRIRARKALIALERFVPALHTSYKIGWYPLALLAAERVVRESPVGVVFTTSPPYSAHFIGRRLKKKYGLPWVADFRDAWTQIATYEAPTSFHARFEKRLERDILHSADLVIANTPRNKEAIAASFGVSPDKIHVIPNGYDPADFEEPPGPEEHSGGFLISCLGNFYQMPSPDRFFRAYRRLTDKHPDVRLRFFGWHAREVREAAQAWLSAGTWTRQDRVSHDQAIRLMRASSVLLCNLPTERAQHWVPGKLYEYMAARRPILLIGPTDGDAAELIRESGAGFVVPNDEEAIYAALTRLHASWLTAPEGREQLGTDLGRYSRPHQTAQLAQLFSDLIEGRDR